MKLYKRMIRPMVIMPKGYTSKPYPIFKNNTWFNEELEESLKDDWEKAVKEEHYLWADLGIEEKYVKIELPKPKPIKIEDNNLVCFMVDVNKIDMDVAFKYVEKYMEILPEGVAVAILPSIEPKVLSKDTVKTYIKEYERIVEEKFK